MKLEEVIAKCLPFAPKILKFESLKIERLILCIPLHAVENGIGDEF